MECRACSETLTAFLDGELTPHEQNLLERHLEECASCQREYESFLYSYELVDKVGAVDIDAALWNRIHSQIILPPARVFSFPALFAGNWLRVAATAAAAVTISVGALWYYPSVAQERETERMFQSYVQQRESAEVSHTAILKTQGSAAWHAIYANPFTDHNHGTLRNPFVRE